MSGKTGRSGTGALMRLDRLLAQEGFCTRSEAGKAVRKGRVLVNGAVEKDPGRKVSPEDTVLFDKEPVGRDQYVYYMLNKPAGVISATEDGRQRTVLDLLRDPQQAGAAGVPQGEEGLGTTGPALEAGAAQDSSCTSPDQNSGAAGDGSGAGLTPAPVLRRGLFPVGRLDRDTEGLLLITDDGQTAHRLLSPARHVDKTYYAVVTGRVGPEEIRAFAGGLKVDDELEALPARLVCIRRDRHTGGREEACVPARPETEAPPEERPVPGPGRGETEVPPEERPVPGPGRRETEDLPEDIRALIPGDLTGLIPPEVTEYTQTLVTIREGKYHQIKRMFAAVGKEVVYLRRLSMGPLLLDRALGSGQFRPLTEEEIRALRMV